VPLFFLFTSLMVDTATFFIITFILIIGENTASYNILYFKKQYRNVRMEKGGSQEGKSGKKVAESKARRREALQLAQTQ
jgi:hypothetical protein